MQNPVELKDKQTNVLDKGIKMVTTLTTEARGPAASKCDIEWT